MRTAEVYLNGELCGHLVETDQRQYVFRYTEDYVIDPSKPMISLTLPKSSIEHRSQHMFPFFFNLISEGSNLSLQSRYHHIDKQDYFGILCATSLYDTIGGVTVKPVEP